MVILRDYLDWCIENVPGTTKEFGNLQFNPTEQRKKIYVMNPAELNETLNKVLSPVSDEGFNLIIRGAIWLVFMGVRPDDIVKIKKSDYDPVSRVINFEGVVFEVFPVACEVFDKLSSLEELNYTNSNALYQGKTIKRKRAERDEILTGFRGISDKSLYMIEFRRRCDTNKIECEWSYTSIFNSGSFFRAYQFEQQFGELDYNMMVQIT